MLNRAFSVALASALALSVPALAGQAAGPRQQAEEILAQLIEFESTADRPEQVVAAVEAMAARLRGAGFSEEDIQVVSPGDDKASLVVRYQGSGDAPAVLMMAHIDVVQANPAGWSFPPFEFGKDENWYYGRGTTDNKTGVTSLVANFIRLRQEGFVPTRDLILMVTGDEETDGFHADWLATERRDLIDAGLALNTDAGGGEYDPNGEPRMFSVQTSEKVYQTFEVTTENPGGHSSVPRADNAIYELAAALGRLSAHSFPVMLNDTTRTGLERMADLTPGELGAAMAAAAAGDTSAAETVAATSPYVNSTLRTTCVATRLQAGHADNALPRSATATVNCRVFPSVPIDDVESALREILDNDAIAMRRVGDARPSPPSPLTPDVMEPVEALVQELWPGTPVIPAMSTGATDGLFVRSVGIPVYGMSAMFSMPDDIRAHGLDERIGIEEFHWAVDYWYRLMRRMGG